MFLNNKIASRSVCKSAGVATVCLDIKIQGSQACFAVTVKAGILGSKTVNLGCA
jgi:hypothetical protein